MARSTISVVFELPRSTVALDAAYRWRDGLSEQARALVSDHDLEALAEGMAMRLDRRLEEAEAAEEPRPTWGPAVTEAEMRTTMAALQRELDRLRVCAPSGGDCDEDLVEQVERREAEACKGPMCVLSGSPCPKCRPGSLAPAKERLGNWHGLRTFEIFRIEDETGVSGKGVVATGVVWPDGKVAMRWKTDTRSTCFYDSIEDVEAIHGHGGKTEVRFDDADVLCVCCLGGTTDTWCADCGARHATVRLPQWAAEAIRKKDRRRIEANKEEREQIRLVRDLLATFDEAYEAWRKDLQDRPHLPPYGRVTFNTMREARANLAAALKGGGG